MIDMEEFLTLRDLFNEELSISEIARQTGHSRMTVRKYLNSQVPPLPQKRSKKPSKLDGHREYIIDRLKEFPLSASRIYREIQDRGFTGKYTIVKDFVREVRPEIGVPAIYRYETKPGVQAQVDWGEVGKVEVDGKSRNFSVLACSWILKNETCRIYVEHRYLQLIQCHLSSFHYFGGFTQEILYENMKQVVIKRALKSSDSEWNSAILVMKINTCKRRFNIFIFDSFFIVNKFLNFT
ncbi:MAG: hypothetical protein QG663_1520 [Thermodesulfobacteriota bacterium]|nr:hypothetical protein [Thermodesulfobacteriota bacterium]